MSFRFGSPTLAPIGRSVLLLLLAVVLLPVGAHAQAPRGGAADTTAPLLTLEAVVDRVTREGFAVRVARGDARTAARNATIGNAGYLPTLDATMIHQGTEASRLSTGGLTGPGGVPVSNLTSYNSTTAGLGLTWTAIDLSRGPTLRRLRADRLRADRVADATLDDALQGAITAYFDVVRQEQLLDAIRETVALSEERLRLAEVQFRAGTASELDAGLARVDLNADRSALLQQEAVRVALQSELSRRMGGTGTERFTVVDSISVDRALRLDALLQTAPEENRQLAAARQTFLASELGVRETRRQRLPTLSLQTGYQWSGFAEGTEPDLFNQDDSFTYGATLSLPLFDGFNRRREIATAQIQVDNARVAVEQQESLLRAALVAAHARYRSGLDQMALEGENVTVARRNVDIAYAQLRTGTITAVDLRQVQLSLLDAQTRLLDATFAAKRAETELRRLSGTIAVPASAHDAR